MPPPALEPEQTAPREGTAKPCVAAEAIAAPGGTGVGVAVVVASTRGGSTRGAPALEPEVTEAEAPAEFPSAALDWSPPSVLDSDSGSDSDELHEFHSPMDHSMSSDGSDYDSEPRAPAEV